jgi:hypothetical protein
MQVFLGRIGKITAAVFREGLKPETKIQLVAVEDIGAMARVVFDVRFSIRDGPWVSSYQLRIERSIHQRHSPLHLSLSRQLKGMSLIDGQFQEPHPTKDSHPFLHSSLEP